MSDFARRRPAQLSGGQQQRVALARALVLNPTVLLLDEPLGALDAKLRKHLQLELKSIQQSVGITFVYVTHDQEEALTMSDRLAVMRDGLVEQIGAPEAVYSEPASAYVAGFLGSANVLDVEVLGSDADAVDCRLGASRCAPSGTAPTGPGKVIVRRSGSSGHGRRGGDNLRPAQHVPRPGRPGGLPRADHPRGAAAHRRADPAGRRAERGRAAGLTVRRRMPRTRDLRAGGARLPGETPRPTDPTVAAGPAGLSGPLHR